MARVSSKVAQVDAVLSLIYVAVGSQSRGLLLDLAAEPCQRHKAQIMRSISVNFRLCRVLLPAFLSPYFFIFFYFIISIDLLFLEYFSSFRIQVFPSSMLL
jgi:hypothetical protein